MTMIAYSHAGQHDQCYVCGTWICAECRDDWHGDCRGDPCCCGCETGP